MAGFREHPLDPVLNAMVQAMQDADQQLGKMAEGMGEFDAKKLTPDEEELLFQNPALRYPGQVEPTTGLPYTNAQAAQKWLQDVGPEQYVADITDIVRRADRRAQEGQASNATTTNGGGSDVAGLAPEDTAQPSPGRSSAGGPVPAAPDALTG